MSNINGAQRRKSSPWQRILGVYPPRRDFVDWVLDLLVGSLLSIMVVITLVNTLGRKFFGVSIIWSTETALACFVWIIFLGAIKLAKYNQHLTVLFLVNKLKPQTRRWVLIILDSVAALYCLLVLLKAGPVIRSAAAIRLSAVPWNADLMFWSLPVGFSGIVFFGVLRIIGRLRNKRVDKVTEKTGETEVV
jgi:TRAP-type C4-dicarboxylate transport system permease small subunit